MATPEDFARACRDAGRNVRRLPAELRRALGQRVRPDITEPLAHDIASAAAGPHARVLSAGVKARTSATPDIVVGGTRPKLSGGAGPRDVVFGDEFGGGKSKRTRQFRRTRSPFVFRTLGRRTEWTLDQYGQIVDDVLEEV